MECIENFTSHIMYRNNMFKTDLVNNGAPTVRCGTHDTYT